MPLPSLVPSTTFSPACFFKITLLNTRALIPPMPLDLPILLLALLTTPTKSLSSSNPLALKPHWCLIPSPATNSNLMCYLSSSSSHIIGHWYPPGCPTTRTHVWHPCKNHCWFLRNNWQFEWQDACTTAHCPKLKCHCNPSKSLIDAWTLLSLLLFLDAGCVCSQQLGISFLD